MATRFQHALLAAVPVFLTPLLIFSLAEGWIDFGGGEKDILLAFPYFLWTLCFFIVALVLIIKRWPLRRWMIRSFYSSTLVILLLGVIAFTTSWLGIS